MSIMFPATATTKPAPAESEASVTLSVQPVGAPITLGLSVSEYWVLAMQTGRPTEPPTGETVKMSAGYVAEGDAIRSVDLNRDLENLLLEGVVERIDGLNVG